MKKIASSSAIALALSLATNVGWAGTVVTGATTMSTNAVPTAYTLLPYVTVSTSPYIAQQTAYDASDIWSQQSTMNEDLFLLQYKQELELACKSQCLSESASDSGNQRRDRGRCRADF